MSVRSVAAAVLIIYSAILGAASDRFVEPAGFASNAFAVLSVEAFANIGRLPW